MTIVDLSDLDTFIRDALYEVRRGIANSRNATQANPLLGVMVDLPDKVDFEIIVTSNYQALLRQNNSIEDRNDSESTIGTSNNASSSNEGQVSLSNEIYFESSKSDARESFFAKAFTRELDNRTARGLDQEKKVGKEIEAESKKSTGRDVETKKGTRSDSDKRSGLGAETDTRSGSGVEADVKYGSGKETDNRNGSGTEKETKRGTGTETDTKSGSGTETDNRNGSGTETETKGGSGTESEQKQGTKTESKELSSGQSEQHLEANDRASKTFDEEDGSWGGQGQISTPQFKGGSPCRC